MSEFKKKAFSTKVGKAEIIAFLIYVIGLIIIISFHELWFDEAQAWQIAKTASLKKILFEIPHYEGHPQLWHLFLAVFAKNGFPYVLTMRAVNVTIASAATSILLFKSPFPKIIRCIIPFNYFFFYQFGIYTRPYCITMLAVFLAAATYAKRNEHPWKYIFSLILLCYSSAYGLIISGTLCFVWTIEIFIQLIKDKKLAKFYKDKRFYSLCFILIVALLIVVSIIPRDNTYYVGVDSEPALLQKILTPSYYLIFLIIPFDSWSGSFLFSNNSGSIVTFITMFVVGSATWTALTAIAFKNKKTFTFLLPAVCTCFFMTFKYVSQHHIGIMTLLIIFTFWIILDSNNGKLEVPELFSKLSESLNSALVKRMVIAVSAVIFCYPLYYNAIACYHDIKFKVGFSDIADFIKENKLEDKKLMSTWEFKEAPEEDDDDNKDDNALVNNKNNISLEQLVAMMEIPSEHPKIECHYTYLNGIAAVTLPFFDKNIFMNFNIDNPDEMYLHYQYKEDYRKVLKQWSEKGLPDFIFCYTPIDEVYDEETLEGVKYLPVCELDHGFIYKDTLSESKDYVYMRSDLFDEYPNLYWVNDPKRNLAKKVNHEDED